MTKSIMDFVAEAKAMVPSISPEELKSILGQDKVLVVDVRDAPELTDTGKVQGALNVSRGMLKTFRVSGRRGNSILQRGVFEG